MKEFPVTSRELWTLGGLQAGSALTLSFAGWLAGFWMNTEQAIALASKDTSQEMLGRWQGYADMSFWAAVIAGLIGLFLIFLTGFNVRGIIKDTTHA